MAQNPKSAFTAQSAPCAPLVHPGIGCRAQDGKARTQNPNSTSSPTDATPKTAGAPLGRDQQNGTDAEQQDVR